MFSLIVKNSANKTLNLTSNPNHITVAEGFNALTANVNTTSSATGHGSVFNSSKIANRNITLQITLRGDIEASRIALYEVFSPLFQLTFFYANEHRKVHISGYLESFDCNPNVSNEVANISVICNDPFLLDDYTDIQSLSFMKGYFMFPCSVPEEGVPFGEHKTGNETIIKNRGEHEVGCIITIFFGKTAYSGDIRIESLLNGQYFELSDMVMQPYDVVIINTNRRNKNVKLYRDGNETDIFSKISDASTWLQAFPGENIWATDQTTSRGDPLYDVDITITPEYLGV